MSSLDRDFIAQAEARARPQVRARGFDALRLEYYQLRARWHDGLWATSEGKLLESDLRLCLQVQGALREHGAVFGAPRTVTLYWDVLNECDVGPQNVLILGERGTGKEVITRVIAGCLGKKCVPVNCALLVENVAESLLFGVSGQAGISGVGRNGSQGFVQQAEGGVLFLDELFDAPPSIFPKLLRLLQERTYYQVGDPQEQRLEDTVIVGASNAYPTQQKLEAAMALGEVRADLVDRFAAFFEIPPLRERREEIPAIAERLLVELNEKMGFDEAGRSRFPFVGLAPESKELLCLPTWGWPGNVRFLGQFLRRQGVLQRHLSPSGSYELQIFREALEQAAPTGAPAVVAQEAEVVVQAGEVSLSTWKKETLPHVREKELLDFLRAEMVREHLGPAQVNADWVAQRLRKALDVKNVSQKLREFIGKTCQQVAQALAQKSL